MCSIQLRKHCRFDKHRGNLDRKANKTVGQYSDKGHVMTGKEPTSETSCLSNILQIIDIVHHNNKTDTLKHNLKTNAPTNNE